MAFTNKFSADFASLIMDRVQAVLERDVNDALAGIDGTLPVFVDFKTPVQIALKFPCLYVEPSQSDLAQSPDDTYIQSQHQLIISLSIVSGIEDVDLLKNQITQYAKAVDRVLRTMPASDLASAVTSARAKPVWEVTQHRFSVLRGNAGVGDNLPTIFRRDAQLLFVVQILER